MGETFSTNNTLSTIVPRTQRTGMARVRRLQHQPRGEVKVVRRLERAPGGSRQKEHNIRGLKVPGMMEWTPRCGSRMLGTK